MNNALNDLYEMLQQKSEQQITSQVYIPSIFNLLNSEDSIALTKLIQEKPFINICDTLENQLKELFKIRFPSKKLSEEEIEELINDYKGSLSLSECGIWIYYPWSEKLVHVLNEEEFIELRTSRNLYKITPEERDLMRNKKIGVIGLSVGQSIALTLVMERICGEIRLADFDTIELSNLNRLRTGLSNLNVNKAISAAREIAEIDPFIKVKCFTDGITEGNIDEFFTTDGKLNILVEECDGMDVKVLSRIKAREYGIPVVMDTNDKGLLDVERYDLEVNRPLLHGLVEDISIEKIKTLSLKEKISFWGPVVNFENFSTRMCNSMPEIGKTITTWPQLASAVMLGGAMVTDICRRIFCNEHTQSGRYYIDFEELIN